MRLFSLAFIFFPILYSSFVPRPQRPILRNPILGAPIGNRGILPPSNHHIGSVSNAIEKMKESNYTMIKVFSDILFLEKREELPQSLLFKGTRENYRLVKQSVELLSKMLPGNEEFNAKFREIKIEMKKKIKNFVIINSFDDCQFRIHILSIFELISTMVISN